ncbi:hypothetical protein B0J17DRAFT_639864 [Rhizoctonia solani]|nr:hypothetical protein B0J17DRAFT_639864 [Rhizoctonia solani]
MDVIIPSRVEGKQKRADESATAPENSSLGKPSGAADDSQLQDWKNSPPNVNHHAYGHKVALTRDQMHGIY